MPFDEIRSAVIELPESDRASLALDILVSLEDAGSEPDAEQAWSEEILSRSNAYRRGELTARDWRESVERIRQILDTQGQEIGARSNAISYRPRRN